MRPGLWLVFRTVAAALLLIALVAYVMAIVSGVLKSDQRLSIADLVGIVVIIGLAAVLLAPQSLDRIQALNIGELKVQLHEIRNDQASQKREIDLIRLALELAVTENERKHLTNLDQPLEVVRYTGNQALKIELRHLRTLELIHSKRYIGQIPDEREFNLREFVELTQRGRDYLKSIAE